MAFCPNCGHPQDGSAVAPAAPPEPVEVVLARINADRDVNVARIEASARRSELATAEHVAEVQADAEVEAAEAVAEIVTAVAEEPDPEPMAEPIVVEAPAPEPEPELDNAPPVVEHHDARKKPTGWWDAYR